MLQSRADRLHLAALAAVAALYSLTVLPFLQDQPIAGGDEGWIISASARLARDGVFGSRLFEGFYGAEDRYYFNLPLHHLLLAGTFDLLGVGLWQARLVSYVFGMAALLLTYALGRRAGGPATGLLASALLVGLRLNLTPFSGLTLTDLGATVRYDLVAVPFGLGGLVLLLSRGLARRPLLALAAGLLLGLSALTQFIGAFYALPALLFLLTLPLAWTRRLLLSGLLACGLLLPFLPYSVYLASGWQDFRGQARSVEQSTDLLSPGFYVRQIVNERHRYAIGTALESLPGSPDEVLRRPSARLALLLMPAALALAFLRFRGDPARRLVALTLAAVLLQLALFESTKRFVYAVGAVPLLVIVLADAARWLWHAGPSAAMRPTLRVGVAALLAAFALEGMAAAAIDLRDGYQATSYAALSRELQQKLPPGAVVLGDNRLWPALEGRELRSLLLLFYHTNPRISRERTTSIAGALERIDPDYLLLSPLSREILSRLSAEHAAELQAFIASRTEPAGTIGAPPYGPMQLYRVRR